MSQDVLEYLEDCYAFLGDPAIGRAIEEIKQLRKRLDLIEEYCDDEYCKLLAKYDSEEE